MNATSDTFPAEWVDEARERDNDLWRIRFRRRWARTWETSAPVPRRKALRAYEAWSAGRLVLAWENGGRIEQIPARSIRRMEIVR